MDISDADFGDGGEGEHATYTSTDTVEVNTMNISEVASAASEAVAPCETSTANNVCVRESTVCECNDAIPVYSDSYCFDSRPCERWLTAASNDSLTALTQAVRQLGYLLSLFEWSSAIFVIIPQTACL